MRPQAILVFFALVLAPWAPVVGCPASPTAAVATPADEACCCDEAEASNCCTLPSDAPVSDRSSPLPCCHAGDAPVPATPSPALLSSPAPAPIAVLMPEPWFAYASGHDAKRWAATTESPPGSSPLSQLSTSRLRL